jgi:hypothetical protein
MMALRVIIVICLQLVILTAYLDRVIDTGMYLSFTVDLVIAWLLVEVFIELRK